METQKVEVLRIELSFYCGTKEDCNRKYTCIIPGIGLPHPHICPHLIAKSDREIHDSIILSRDSRGQTQ